MTTPNESLARLEAGNNRYRDGRLAEAQDGKSPRNFVDLSSGQAPYAAVLACADSRVLVEAIFDEGPGQLFVIRVAGNVAEPGVVGSLEFAVEELGVSLIMVMGHTGCGAVGASLAHLRSGGEEELTPGLQAVVSRIHMPGGGGEDQTADWSPREVERHHAQAVAREVVAESRILAEAVASDTLQVTASLYHLETGRVELLS
jgi:carbonic anhydrase